VKPFIFSDIKKSNTMLLNFRFNGTEHAKLLEQALSSLNEDSKSVKLSAMSGQSLKVSSSLKFFSPFFREIIESIPLVNEEQTIILPDYSSTSIKHLINLLLLTEGCTQSCAALELEDVADIKEVAKTLRIDLKNLVYDERTNQSDLINVEDELENCEIKDDEENEDNVPKVQEHGQEHLASVPIECKIKIASFAKADVSIPNLVHNGSGRGGGWGGRTMLVVRNIPEELNTITNLNGYFSQYGNLVKVQVGHVSQS
jgi:hypothetical protein